MSLIADHRRRVRIYQIQDTENVRYAFRPINDYDIWCKSDYVCVKDYMINPTCHYTDEDVLDDLFRISNTYGLGKDYTGRSISLSDIVVINQKAYYCDTLQWVVIHQNWDEI
jgi:hypothetical protein